MRIRRLLLVSSAVTAIVAAACARSPESSYREPAGAPVRLMATSLVGGVRVEWESVAGADGYVLVAGTGAAIEIPADVVAVSVTSLAPHVLHPFAVASRERDSLSPFSAEVHARTLTGREVTAEPVFVTEPSRFFAAMATGIAPAGDVDADGYADVWVSAGGLLFPGEARLYYGHPFTAVDYTRMTVLTGPCVDCEAGTQLTTGDLDGDGRLDLLLVEGQAIGPRARLTAYRGASAGLGTALSWSYQSPGGTGNPRALDALATGDIDGDGFDDVLAGSAAFSTSGVPLLSGRVDVFFGPGPADGSPYPPGQSKFGTLATQRFGESVALGDANGDGFADALVAAVTEEIEEDFNAGRVRLFLGSAAGLETSETAAFDGTVHDGRFGSALGLFDLDADGSTEIVIGDPSALDQRGRVCVHRLDAPGSVTLVHCMEGEGEGDRFGAALAAADVNGDGIDDLLVTAETPRSISIFGGTPAGVDPFVERVIDGRAPGGGVSFGLTIAGIGDLDGDGDEEIGVGEPDYSSTTIFEQGRFWTYRSVGVPESGPRADAGLSSSPVAGVPFHPAAAIATDPGGAAFSCIWSWGDGSEDTVLPDCTQGSVAAVSHVYTNAGELTLRLRVETDDGRTAEGVTRLTVKEEGP